MARASTPTLLSLDDYAKLTGINPAHFNGAANSNVTPVDNNTCQDLWVQYSWQQSDMVSREGLAISIAEAEAAIADLMGYWPAPVWISEDVMPYPQFHRPDLVQYGQQDVKGYGKGIRARWGQIIAPGRRAVSCTEDVDVAYSTEDGDVYDETATVSVATTETDAREVKVYFAGHSGEREWEIRPSRTKSISGGTFTATFWSWQMIDPDLWEALPTTDDLHAIDWADTDNLVATVDVCREYNDATEVSARFYWEPMPPLVTTIHSVTPDEPGALTTQDGVCHVRDTENGLLVPLAATYDSDDAQWETDTLLVCRDPDFVKAWYYCGAISDGYLRSTSNDPLSLPLARAIMWLATARLERPLCACSNVTSLSQSLQSDLSMVGEGGHMLSDDVLNCPLGTRRGEIMAWRAIRKMHPQRARVAIL